MYNPASFAEDRAEVLHAFMREHPLATLVSCGPGGLEATHVPMILDAEASVLRCHVARANAHWKSVAEAGEVLAIFQGPEHYITPAWYESKQEHGKVVPTWNYVAVHVRGRGRIFEEREELMAHLKELTERQEQRMAAPWAVEDAPRDYVEALTKAIVGIEISVDAIEGKWKASQNRPEKDRRGVVAGLEELHTAASVAMAEMVKRRKG